MDDKKNIKETKIKSKVILLSLLFFTSFITTSCSVVEGIFKAGFGIGIFVTIAIIALIIYIISRFLKK